MKSYNLALKYACCAALAVSMSTTFIPRSTADRALIAQASSASLYAQAIPIKMTTPQCVILNGESFICSVSIASVPPSGGYVQIMCDTPTAVSNSSGSWPYTVYFAPGSSTTASFTLNANTVTGTTTANLTFGSSTADPNNPSEWTEGGPVTITSGD